MILFYIFVSTQHEQKMPHAAIRWYYILRESMQSAYRTVILNKLRTLLSLLGVTIGIFAIVSVFTALNSMEKNIRESFSAMGDDVIYIQKWPWAPEEGVEYKWWEYWNRPVPTMKEYQQLKKRMESARAVAFFAVTQSTIESGNASAENIAVWGVTEEFENTRNFDIASGRFLTPLEINTGKNLAVIGASIKDELFNNVDPIGKTIKIKGRYLKIIGVFEKEGKSMFGGGSMDKVVLIPVRFLGYIG